MPYSLIAALFAFFFILLALLLTSESFYSIGLVITVYVVIGALILDLATFMYKQPAVYSLAAAFLSLMLILLVARFAPKSFFASEYYGIFLCISMLALFSALATVCYKLIELLFKLLR